MNFLKIQFFQRNQFFSHSKVDHPNPNQQTTLQLMGFQINVLITNLSLIFLLVCAIRMTISIEKIANEFNVILLINDLIP